MIAEIVEQKKAEIVALCRKYRVRALWLFGSATTDEFDPETSDVDFLVDLGGYEGRVLYRYLDLADELEAIVGRDVDLVSLGGLRNNPRFRADVEAMRVVIYDAGADETAA